MNRRIEEIRVAAEYGFEAQSRMLLEEMAELTKAVCKYARVGYPTDMPEGAKNYGKHSPEYLNLTEELADVQIVLDQVEFLLGNEKKVDEAIEQKLERQIERIERENGGSGK